MTDQSSTMGVSRMTTTSYRIGKGFAHGHGFSSQRADLMLMASNWGREIERMRGYDAEDLASGARTESELCRPYYIKTQDILLTGLAGYGKTRFARDFARHVIGLAKSQGWPTVPPSAMADDVRVTDEWTSPTLPRYRPDYFRMIEYRCSKRTTISDLARIFRWATAFAVIILDEIHNCSKAVQEWLLPILVPLNDSREGVAWDTAIRSDGLIGGEGGLDYERYQRMSFLVIGTTTDESKLIRPLFDRFRVIHLDGYTEEEMHGVVVDMVASAEMELTDAALRLVVDRSRLHPRTAAKIVARIKDQWVAAGHPDVVDLDAVERACEMARIGPFGFSDTDVATLQVLADSDRAIGSQNLAVRCRLGTKENLEQEQQWMLVEGLVQVVSGGRMITAEGRRKLQQYRVLMGQAA